MKIVSKKNNISRQDTLLNMNVKFSVQKLQMKKKSQIVAHVDQVRFCLNKIQQRVSF